jgi:hypothetical protein
MSDESVSGINELRKPTVVVSVRVSESCWGTIVRRRLCLAERAFPELASGSTFVRILIPFCRHRRESFRSELREKANAGQIRVLIEREERERRRKRIIQNTE